MNDCVMNCGISSSAMLSIGEHSKTAGVGEGEGDGDGVTVGDAVFVATFSGVAVPISTSNGTQEVKTNNEIITK